MRYIQIFTEDIQRSCLKIILIDYINIILFPKFKSRPKSKEKYTEFNNMSNLWEVKIDIEILNFSLVVIK